MYRFNIEADILVLHGPPAFWPESWDLADVGDVSTVALAVLAAGYTVWTLLVPRIHRSIEIRKQRWPVQLVEVETTIELSSESSGRLNTARITSKYLANPARWTWTPGNNPRVLRHRIIGPIVQLDEWLVVSDDLGTELPYEKEFSSTVHIKNILDMKTEQQRDILEGNITLMLEVRSALPPKQACVSVISLSRPAWKDEIKRDGLLKKLNEDTAGDG